VVGSREVQSLSLFSRLATEIWPKHGSYIKDLPGLVTIRGVSLFPVRGAQAMSVT